VGGLMVGLLLEVLLTQESFEWEISAQDLTGAL
jgi:hypothetical protein